MEVSSRQTSLFHMLFSSPSPRTHLQYTARFVVVVGQTSQSAFTLRYRSRLRQPCGHHIRLAPSTEPRIDHRPIRLEYGHRTDRLRSENKTHHSSRPRTIRTIELLAKLSIDTPLETNATHPRPTPIQSGTHAAIVEPTATDTTFRTPHILSDSIARQYSLREQPHRATFVHSARARFLADEHFPQRQHLEHLP